MDRESLRNALAQSLEDRRLSRSERKSLRSIFEDMELDASDRNWLRSEAFSQVGGNLPPESRQALEWLQDVVGLALSVSDRVSPPATTGSSKASPKMRTKVVAKEM